MIWFDIKALEKKISDNELSEKDSFNYVLAYAIVFTVAVILASVSGGGIVWMQIISCLISVLIVIWGITQLFKVNKALDGKDFCKRFIAISWVVGVRVILIAIGIGIILGLVILIKYSSILSDGSGINPLSDNMGYEIVSLVISTLISILYYWMAIKSFRRLTTVAG